MSRVEEGALVHCADALQYGSTSVSSAGTQPAPLRPSSLLMPFFSFLHITAVVYYIYIFLLVSPWHAHNISHSVLYKCGYFQAEGPWSQPCHSLHYQLCLSICPSVHHGLHPAAHLAVLLASLPRTRAPPHCSGLPSKTELLCS